MPSDKPVLRTTKHVVLALGLAFIVLWFLPDVGAWFNRKPDEAWARVQKSGVFKFAIDPTYMPFDGLGSHGDFFGIDVDLANEMARRLDVRAEFVMTGRDSLYDVLTVGQAEATISALNVDPAREGKWHYSRSYFDAGQVLIKPQGVLKTLEVSSIAVELGSNGDAAARWLARRQAGVTVEAYGSRANALQAVMDGRAQSAIVDAVTAAQLIPAKYPTLQRGDYVTHDLYAVAVGRESLQLLDAINRALADMQRDGTTQRIVDEWMKK
jgi:ABC-type amino acid transport substrate-binding protein